MVGSSIVDKSCSSMNALTQKSFFIHSLGFFVIVGIRLRTGGCVVGSPASIRVSVCTSLAMALMMAVALAMRLFPLYRARKFKRTIGRFKLKLMEQGVEGNCDMQDSKYKPSTRVRTLKNIFCTMGCCTAQNFD